MPKRSSSIAILPASSTLRTGRGDKADGATPNFSAPMTSCICTLVEGDFHLGLGVLANSLVHHGFKGNIWVGYRGQLPAWAATAQAGERWREFPAAPGVNLCFVALDTKAHFTNYKPEFLLRVWDEFQPG